MLEEVKKVREGGQGGNGAGTMFKNSNFAVFHLHRLVLKDGDAPPLCQTTFATLRSLSGGFPFVFTPRRQQNIRFFCFVKVNSETTLSQFAQVDSRFFTQTKKQCCLNYSEQLLVESVFFQKRLFSVCVNEIFTNKSCVDV